MPPRSGVNLIDPADRLTWEAGDAAQCDLWFPPRKITLENGASTLLPVLVMTLAYLRFVLARMIPSKPVRKVVELIAVRQNRRQAYNPTVSGVGSLQQSLNLDFVAHLAFVDADHVAFVEDQQADVVKQRRIVA